MRFYNSTHEKTYLQICCSKDDRELNAIAYLCALSEAISPGSANRIFDFKNRIIKPNALNEEWQTSGTRKLTLLVFNLWCGYVSDYAVESTVYHIFGTDLDEFFIQAIKLKKSF